MRWLLVLRYAGFAFEFDDIEPEITRALEAGTSTTDPMECSLEIELTVDVAALEEAGHRLDAAEGDLYLDGTLVMRGRVVDPQYGDPEMPIGWVSFTLRSSPLEDRSLFPPAAATVTDETWPTADPSSLGRSYPWPYGAPGTFTYPGSPAYLVQSADVSPVVGPQYVLISDDWVECDEVNIVVPDGGSADGVTVSSTKYDDRFTVIRTTDALGRRVSVIDLWEQLFGGVPTLPRARGTEYYARWDVGRARSGQMGDVVEFLLRQSSVAVDYGRLAAAIPVLNRYTLGGYIDEPVVPVEWLAEVPIPLGQVALVSSDEGLHPLPWPPDRTEARAVAHLEAGADCDPRGPIRWQGQPLNELTIRCQPRADADEYIGTVTITPDNDPYAEASRRRYAGDAQNGVYAEVIEADCVDTVAQAAAMGREMVRRRWSRERVAEYVLWPELHTEIERGDLVTITDAARSWSRKLAVVQSRSDDPDVAVVTLVIDDDPFRDAR